MLFATAAFSCVSGIMILYGRRHKRAAQVDIPYIHESEAWIDTRNTLVLLSGDFDVQSEIVKSFCGYVVSDPSTITAASLFGRNVYLCGDLSTACMGSFGEAQRVFVIHEYCHGVDKCNAQWEVIDSGRVPLLIHGVGVFYRRFFDTDADFFSKVCEDHSFQALTESTKPGTAHRTGIYLTPVIKDGDDFRFHLLRCSSNLSGPTGDFRSNDQFIVDSLNAEAKTLFHNSAPMNHVLAQIYHNTAAAAGKKETKAKIKDHSDKTKDMPRNGVMAFCTFYDKKGIEKLQAMGPGGFDYGKRGVSGLTKLSFRLKPEARRTGCTLTPKFSVTLYPNSVFLMSLSTNRLYTHEIRPGALNAELLPTRLGYVVRCSNTAAIYRNERTYIEIDDSSGKRLVEMEPPTAQGMQQLRNKYAEENASAALIDYGPVLFSMNRGDYERPLVYEEEYKESENFRIVMLPAEDKSIFEDLLNSVMFEDVCKGRKGAVLVQPHPARGVPIVRTTTKYSQSAKCFKLLHIRLAEQIQNSASLPVGFNNALIEKYTDAYATMGFHSDQALDLEENSFVALFSCYKYPDLSISAPRRLIVESKEPGAATRNIPMNHNSVIIFSMNTNSRFKHKIIRDPAAPLDGNEWIGVTFRLSKTYVNFNDQGEPILENGVSLAIADDACRSEFYKLRRFENQQTDFVYPPVSYTISSSDRRPPVL